MKPRTYKKLRRKERKLARKLKRQLGPMVPFALWFGIGLALGLGRRFLKKSKEAKNKPLRTNWQSFVLALVSAGMEYYLSQQKR